MVGDARAWLSAFEQAAADASRELGRRETAEARARDTGGIGAGGDRTLEIDAAAEDAVFRALERLAQEGHSFTAVSEERGIVSFGSSLPLVAVDPIDGSLNAKRGMPHASMSIAVSAGHTVADVEAAFVWDYERREGFSAVRGEGAALNGHPIQAPLAERRHEDGRLELLCIETSDSEVVASFAPGLAEVAFRWRILGSIATAMCQVATSRVDGMVNVSECRVIDAAAAALIVRESGGAVLFSGGDALRLELDARTKVATARTDETAARLLAVVA